MLSAAAWRFRSMIASSLSERKMTFGVLLLQSLVPTLVHTWDGAVPLRGNTRAVVTQQKFSWPGSEKVQIPVHQVFPVPRGYPWSRAIVVSVLGDHLEVL